MTYEILYILKVTEINEAQFLTAKSNDLDITDNASFKMYLFIYLFCGIRSGFGLGIRALKWRGRCIVAVFYKFSLKY